MEMATAVATTANAGSSTTASFLTSTSGKKSGNDNNSLAAAEGHSADKWQGGKAFEIRTRKDQGSSTYSPIKVSKLFHRLKAHEPKPGHPVKNGHEKHTELQQHTQKNLSPKSSHQIHKIFGKNKDHLNLTKKESKINDQSKCKDKGQIYLHDKNNLSLQPTAEVKQDETLPSVNKGTKTDETLTSVNEACKTDGRVPSGRNFGEGREGRYLEMNFSPLSKSFLKKSASENGKGLKKSAKQEQFHQEELSTLQVRQLDKVDIIASKRHSIGESFSAEHSRKSLCRSCQENKSQGLCERTDYINTDLSCARLQPMFCQLNCCDQNLKLYTRAPQRDSCRVGVLQNLDSDNKKIVVTEKFLHFSSDSLETEGGLKPFGDVSPSSCSERSDATVVGNVQSERKLNNSSYRQRERKCFSSPDPTSQQQLNSPTQSPPAAVKAECPCTVAWLGENSFTSSDAGSPTQDSRSSQIKSKVPESKISKTFHKLFQTSSPKGTELKLQESKASPDGQTLDTSQSSNSSSSMASPQKQKSRSQETSKPLQSLCSPGRDTVIKNGHSAERTSYVGDKAKSKNVYLAENKIGVEKNSVTEMEENPRQYVLGGQEFEHRYRLYYDDEFKTDGSADMMTSSDKTKGGRAHCRVYYKEAEDEEQVRNSSSHNQGTSCYPKTEPGGLRYLFQMKDNGQGSDDPEFTYARNQVMSYHKDLNSCSAAASSQLSDLTPLHKLFLHGPDSRPSFAMSRPLQMTSVQNGLGSSPVVHEDIRENAVQKFNRESSQGSRTPPVVIPDLPSSAGQGHASSGSAGHSTAAVPSFVVDKNGAPCIPSDSIATTRASSESVSDPHGNGSNQACAREPGEARGQLHKDSRAREGAANMSSAPFRLPYASAVYEESSSYKPKKLNLSAKEVKVIESHNLSSSRSVSTGASSDHASFRFDQHPQRHRSLVTDKFDISNNLFQTASSCTAEPKKQYNVFKDNSRNQRPESYPSKSGEGRRSQGFLRASSPNNFFSNVHYRDYVIANRSSDSGTLVASESDCQATSQNPPNTSGTRSERRGKHKVLVNIGKARSGRQMTEVIEMGQCQQEDHPSKHSRRQRLDGVILRTPDHKTFQPQHVRHSDEPRSDLYRAMFRNVSYVPYFNNRPLSHPHVDREGAPVSRHGQNFGSRHAGRHSSAFSDLTRYSPGLDVSSGLESSSAPAPRCSRSGLQPCTPDGTLNPIKKSSSSQNYRLNGESPTPRSHSRTEPRQMSHPSPDLLQLDKNSQAQETSAPNKEKTTKKSFLSRLAQPMSFFYRDPKPSS